MKRVLAIAVLFGWIAGCASSKDTGVSGRDIDHAPDGHAHVHDDQTIPHSHLHAHHDSSASCTCAEAIHVNGWCGSCNVGYVASIPIESAMLFEALDAHGHEINIDGLACPTCLQARAENGFCLDCRMGFVDDQAYFSPVSHALAKGVTVRVDAIECTICRSLAKRSGWCESCHVGMAGNVRFSERDEFDAGALAIETIVSAVEHIDTCELCAAAMVVDGRCPRCRISYRGGVEAP